MFCANTILCKYLHLVVNYVHYNTLDKNNTIKFTLDKNKYIFHSSAYSK